jgi:hypothetical protein
LTFVVDVETPWEDQGQVDYELIYSEFQEYRGRAPPEEEQCCVLVGQSRIPE